MSLSKIRWWVSPAPHIDQYEVRIVRYEFSTANTGLGCGFSESAPLPKPKPMKVIAQFHIDSTGCWKQHLENEVIEPAFVMSGQFLHALEQAQLVNREELANTMYDMCMEILEALRKAGKEP